MFQAGVAGAAMSGVVAGEGAKAKSGIPVLHAGSHFRHGLLQLMIHTIDPLHDGKNKISVTQCGKNRLLSPKHILRKQFFSDFFHVKICLYSRNIHSKLWIMNCFIRLLVSFYFCWLVILMSDIFTFKWFLEMHWDCSWKAYYYLPLKMYSSKYIGNTFLLSNYNFWKFRRLISSNKFDIFLI